MDDRSKQTLVLEDGKTVLYHHGDGNYRFEPPAPTPAPPEERAREGGEFEGLEDVFLVAEGFSASGRDVEDNLKRLHKLNTGRSLRKDRKWCLSFLASKGIGRVTGSRTRLEGVWVDTSTLAPHSPEFVTSFVLEKDGKGEAYSLTSNKDALAKEFRRAWRNGGRGSCYQTMEEILVAVDAAIRDLKVLARRRTRSLSLPGR